MAAFRHTDKEGRALLKALLEGAITHTLGSRCSSLAHAEGPRVTRGNTQREYL